MLLKKRLKGMGGRGKRLRQLLDNLKKTMLEIEGLGARFYFVENYI
jgi:NDP-sugar pyrophosphorylase family protein